MKIDEEQPIIVNPYVITVSLKRLALVDGLLKLKPSARIGDAYRIDTSTVALKRYLFKNGRECDLSVVTCIDENGKPKGFIPTGFFLKDEKSGILTV